MLSWTAAGAVPWPTTLQMRIAANNSAQMRAGAPTPTRSLSLDEIESNFIYFGQALETKRSKGSKRLTLSGAENVSAETLGAIVEMAKKHNFETIILHASANMLRSLPWNKWNGIIDILSIGLTSVNCIVTVKEFAHRALHSNINLRISLPLRNEFINHLDRYVEDLLEINIQGLTLTYPFPSKRTLPPPPAMAGKAAYKAALGKKNVSIKGLPLCLLPKGANLPQKTSNRWYVDADHQKKRAR